MNNLEFRTQVHFLSRRFHLHPHMLVTMVITVEEIITYICKTTVS